MLAPSILSADFARLGEEIRAIEEGKADWVHVDVMDGHFVPNITIGPPVVKALRHTTRLPLDCHLMVNEPEKWVQPFAQAGATLITVHVEATVHLDRLLRQIRELGCRPGVSLNPATPVSSIQHVLGLVDLVLVMSVNPGFGGQEFIDYSLEKVKELVKLRKSQSYLIEIDGGVSKKNIKELKQAGVDVFVAGSSVFSTQDPKKALNELRSQLT